MNVVKPSLIMRIGLTYSNLVIVDDSEEIAGMVNEHFGLPICKEFLGVNHQFHANTSLKTVWVGLQSDLCMAYTT